MNDAHAEIVKRVADVIRTMEAEWMTRWIVLGTVKAVIRSERPERKGELPDVVRAIADGIREKDGGGGSLDDAERVEDWTERTVEARRADPAGAVADMLDGVAAGRERRQDLEADRPAREVSDGEVFAVFRAWRRGEAAWDVPFRDWLPGEVRAAEERGDVEMSDVLRAVDALLDDADDGEIVLSVHAVGAVDELQGTAAVAAWRLEVAAAKRDRTVANAAVGAAVALARGFGIDDGRPVGGTERERIWDTLSAELARAGAPADGRTWELARDRLHDWLDVHCRSRDDARGLEPEGREEPEEPEAPLRAPRRETTGGRGFGT